MPYKIVVVGASAGGIEALRVLVGQLPRNINAAVFVTVHVSPGTPSLLPGILSRPGPLRACHPKQGEPVRPGLVYIAPPDYHLILRPGRIHLAHGPRENGSRPAIDPMFRSAARFFRKRVIGILLSGTLDDGTAGLGTIKTAGGTTIAQEPSDALFGEMPRHAIDAGVVDHVAALPEMGGLLTRLIGEAREPAAGPDGNDVTAADESAEQQSHQERQSMADSTDEIVSSDNPPQEATDFTCPDCGGVMRVVIGDGHVIHYRCHVGHGWSTDSLRAAQIEKIEESLWVALRTLEENRKLVQRLLDEVDGRGLTALADHYRKRIRHIDYHAARIRQVLMHQLGDEEETDFTSEQDRNTPEEAT